MIDSEIHKRRQRIVPVGECGVNTVIPALPVTRVPSVAQLLAITSRKLSGLEKNVQNMKVRGYT